MRQQSLLSLQAAARHVKGSWYGKQQGISGPEKFRQIEAIQPMKAGAVKR